MNISETYRHEYVLIQWHVTWECDCRHTSGDTRGDISVGIADIDIGKTITNNILPSSLSAYSSSYREIESFCRSAVTTKSVISVHFRIMSRYSHGYVLVCI